MPLELDMFETIVRRRRSVRAFLPDPIPEATIRHALSIAACAPSSCNTQPWIVYIASRDSLERLRAALVTHARDGGTSQSELERAAPYTGVYRERQVDAAIHLFKAQGVARGDREARMRSYLRNYEFFDAPHAAFIFLPPDGALREAADCGKFAQTFMLALSAAGAGSCPQGSLGDFPDIVRAELGIRDEPGRLLFGISFGYPDADDPTAEVRPGRGDVDDFVSFH